MRDITTAQEIPIAQCLNRYKVNYVFAFSLDSARYFDDISRPAALYGITEGGRERFAYRANVVGSGRRVVLESAPRVGGFAVRRKPPTLSKLFPSRSPCLRRPFA